MSPLLLQQMDFAERSAEFILWIKSQGFRVTYGETWRSPEEAMIHAKDGSGIANSLHLIRLAIDLNVFKDGVELQTKEEFAPLGAHWKTVDPRCCWGGDFKRIDADHFSMVWQGIK